MFQSLVMKRAILLQKEDEDSEFFSFKESLVTYLVVTCELADGQYSHLIEDVRGVLSVLTQCDFDKYAFFSCAVLANLSAHKRKVNINSQLTLDC
jgi:hypothetical protein